MKFSKNCRIVAGVLLGLIVLNLLALIPSSLYIPTHGIIIGWLISVGEITGIMGFVFGIVGLIFIVTDGNL